MQRHQTQRTKSAVLIAAWLIAVCGVIVSAGNSVFQATIDAGSPDERTSAVLIQNDHRTAPAGIWHTNGGHLRASNVAGSAVFAELQPDGTWASSSDARLKKNVRSVGETLGRLMKLEPVSYEWHDPNVPGRSLGFLAQDVRTLFPELVSGDIESYYRLDYSGLAVIAIDALQELKKSHDTQMEAIRDQHDRDIRALECEVMELRVMVEALAAAQK